MVTRRVLLKGAAAGSIAAIASAHGAPPPPADAPVAAADGLFGTGYGSLDGGAVGGFLKVTDGFNVFFKFHKTGAEVFMKEVFGAIDTHIKFFDKAWGPEVVLDPIDGFLKDAVAGFYKLDTEVAGIFLKLSNNEVYTLNVYADGGYDTEPPDVCGLT